MRLVYLVGPPGAGKSTLMARLTDGLARVPTEDGGVPRDLLMRGPELVGIELGRRRDGFSGTDALHLGIHPTACEWIKTATAPLVLAEGQRLATTGFLEAATSSGRSVELLWLDPPADVCAHRRAVRAARLLAAAQAPSFVKGATTRAARLAATAELIDGVRVRRLDADGTPAEVEAEARTYLGGMLDA